MYIPTALQKQPTLIAVEDKFQDGKFVTQVKNRTLLDNSSTLPA
jgi:hypothetical protein